MTTNVTIRYTQPELITGQVIRTVDHVIPCDDVNTFANGELVPEPSHANWNAVISDIANQPNYEKI